MSRRIPTITPSTGLFIVVSVLVVTGLTVVSAQAMQGMPAPKSQSQPQQAHQPQSSPGIDWGKLFGPLLMPPRGPMVYPGGNTPEPPENIDLLWPSDPGTGLGMPPEIPRIPEQQEPTPTATPSKGNLLNSGGGNPVESLTGPATPKTPDTPTEKTPEDLLQGSPGNTPMSPIDLAQEGPGIITQDDRGNTYLDGVWTGGPDNPENPQPKSSQPKLGSNVDPNNPAVKQLIENPKGSQTTTPPPVPPAPLTAPPSVASSEPTKPATGAPPSVASSGPTTTTTSPSSAKAGLDKALKAADKLDKQAKDKGLDLPGIDNVLEHVPGGKHLNPAREVINTGKDFLRNIQKTPEERKEWGKQQMEEKAKPVTDALKGIREKATQPGGFMNPQQQQLEDMDLKMPTDNN